MFEEADPSGDDYVPPRLVSSSETMSDTAGDNPKGWKGRRWIVDECRLMELFTFCPKCGASISHLYDPDKCGSRLEVKWDCHEGCLGTWSSCAKPAKTVADNNLLISASIFFTGATYTDISEWAELINLQIPQKTIYYDIQAKYLIPVIHSAYKDQNCKIIERLQQLSTEGSTLIELCGDARADSPGNM